MSAAWSTREEPPTLAEAEADERALGDAGRALWQAVEKPLGDRLGDALRDMVREHESAADRSQQVELGPSEIGNPCTSCLARKVLGLPSPRYFDDPWARIIGTAVHAWLDDAAVSFNVRHDFARFYPEQRVHPDPELLPNGGRCDVYDVTTSTVIDHKVVGLERLKSYRVNGPGLTYRRQGHLYGLGYARAGHVVENVAVAFWSRGGRLADLWVWVEPYDEQLATEALDRYRVIREQALAIGPGIVDLLPRDADCFDCGGRA